MAVRLSILYHFFSYFWLWVRTNFHCMYIVYTQRHYVLTQEALDSVSLLQVIYRNPGSSNHFVMNALYIIQFKMKAFFAAVYWGVT